MGSEKTAVISLSVTNIQKIGHVFAIDIRFSSASVLELRLLLRISSDGVRTEMEHFAEGDLC